MRLLGRDHELSTIDAFLAADDGPATLLICGEPGIGKSTLWEHAVTAAAGYRVLAARPAQAEQRLGYSALADLLDGVDDDVLARLRGPQHDALQIALLRTRGIADARAVSAALLATLRGLAASRSVLVAVDDLAVLDRPSARALTFALRRMGRPELRLLATARTDWKGELPRLPTDTLGPGAVTLLRPRGLDASETAQLVAEPDGEPPARSLLQRLQDATDGNPGLVLELMAANGKPGAAPLRVPGSVRRLLPRMPEQARAGLLLVALADGDLAVVLAAGDDATRHTLDEAEAAGLVQIGSRRVRFVPSLSGAALIAAAPANARRAAHGRLAAVTHGVASARHHAAASAGPDAVTASVLDGAARTAGESLDFPAAAELAELAISLTPTVELDAGRHRRLVAAEHWFEAGDPVRSRELIEDALRAPGSWRRRAEALSRLAKYQRYAGEPLDVWDATLRAALDAAPEDEVTLRVGVLMQLAMAACNSGNAADAPGYVAGMGELAEHCPPEIGAQLAGGRVFFEFLTGNGIRHDLIGHALAELDHPSRLPVELRPTYSVAVSLVDAGELDEARHILEREYASAELCKDDTGLPILAWALVRLETWAGNWVRAEQVAEQGRCSAERAGSAAGQAFVAAAHANLLACRGDADQARDEAARASCLADQIGIRKPIEIATEAIAALELACGDAAAAERAVAALPPLTLASGLAEPGIARSLPDRIEALVRLGRLDAAEALLRPFTESARSVNREWALAAGGRCQALLHSASGESVDADRAMAAALEHAERLGMPVEHGRTLLIGSEVHRRARRRMLAREHAIYARRIFDRVGAVLWSQRCAIELARSVGRPAHPDSQQLTSTELRVATLAAEGYTTREIATALFAGVRTVESHLQQVYRKLGVRSRVELSRRLGEPNSADSTDSSATGAS